MSWNDFFSSQLFGVVIGALMTGGFTWLLDCLRYKRERKAVLFRNAQPLTYKVLRDKDYGAPFISDHYPVVMTATF